MTLIHVMFNWFVISIHFTECIMKPNGKASWVQYIIITLWKAFQCNNLDITFQIYPSAKYIPNLYTCIHPGWFYLQKMSPLFSKRCSTCIIAVIVFFFFFQKICNQVNAINLSKVKAFYLCPQPVQFNPKRAFDSFFGPHREDTHLCVLVVASRAGMRTAGGRSGPGEDMQRRAGSPSWGPAWSPTCRPASGAWSSTAGVPLTSHSDLWGRWDPSPSPLSRSQSRPRQTSRPVI